MAANYDELRKMKPEDLIQKFDEQMKPASERRVLIAMLHRDELLRRGQRMHTRAVTICTAVILVLTAVNVYLVWKSVSPH